MEAVAFCVEALAPRAVKALVLRAVKSLGAAKALRVAEADAFSAGVRKLEKSQVQRKVE